MPNMKKAMIQAIADSAQYLDHCLVLTTAVGFIIGNLVPEEAAKAIIPNWSAFLEEGGTYGNGEYIVLKNVRVRVGNDADRPDFSLEFMVVFLADIIGISVGK